MDVLGRIEQLMEQRGLLDKWALLTAEQKQLVLNMIDNMK